MKCTLGPLPEYSGANSMSIPGHFLMRLKQLVQVNLGFHFQRQMVQADVVMTVKACGFVPDLLPQGQRGGTV